MGAGREHGTHACGLQRIDIALGDDPAHDNDHVCEPFGPQAFHDSRDQRQVRPGQQRKPHRVRVLLHRGADHLLGCLVEAGVDDLEAGVSQGAGDHLGASVVAIETRLGHDDAVATVHSLAILGSTGHQGTNRSQRSSQDFTAGSRTKATRLRCKAAASTTHEWKIS